MKRMFSYERGRAEARIYKQSNNTYLVRFYVDGELRPDADYETDNFADAEGTTQYIVNNFNPPAEPAMREVRAVWYVVGDEDNFRFDTKMDAERHARILFPIEDVHKRYARIFYQTVYTYEPNRKETQ